MTIDLDKMTPIAEPQVKARGLSYSSFTEYSACARKYFLRKIKKVAVDTDATEDFYHFNIGKAFHRALENTRHDLTGFSFAACALVCKEFGLEDEDDACLVFSMLSAYKRVHAKTNLKVVACEVVIDTPGMYGIVDTVFQEEDGKVWISDTKTCATFQQSTLNTVTDHVQLLLYSRHYDAIAYAAGVKDMPFAGVRLRSTTKSKLVRKTNETLQEYIARMSKGIKSYDIVVPAALLTNIDSVYKQHQRANEITSKATLEDEEKFAPNYQNCLSFYKPCPYYKQCFGRNYTDAPKVEVIES